MRQRQRVHRPRSASWKVLSWARNVHRNEPQNKRKVLGFTFGCRSLIWVCSLSVGECLFVIGFEEDTPQNIVHNSLCSKLKLDDFLERVGLEQMHLKQIGQNKHDLTTHKLCQGSVTESPPPLPLPQDTAFGPRLETQGDVQTLLMWSVCSLRIKTQHAKTWSLNSRARSP